MARVSRQQILTDQAAIFRQSLADLHEKITSPVAQELTQSRYGPKGLGTKDGFHFGTNPSTIYHAADVLHSNDFLTMGELSTALTVPLSTATRMVDWLVDKGIALRTSDPNDRRIVRVALTDGGRQMHEFIERRTAHRIKKLLGCLTVEEQSTLLALIQKVVSSIDNPENVNTEDKKRKGGGRP